MFKNKNLNFREGMDNLVEQLKEKDKIINTLNEKIDEFQSKVLFR